MVSGYVAALAVTVAVETPLYAAGLRRLAASAPAPPGRRQAAVMGAVVNLASHPLAWLVLWPLAEPRLGALGALAAVEAFVAVGEWAALRWWLGPSSGGERAAVLAVLVLVANAASMAAGALIVAL
jgi:hypothetical protein